MATHAAIDLGEQKVSQCKKMQRCTCVKLVSMIKKLQICNRCVSEQAGLLHSVLHSASSNTGRSTVAVPRRGGAHKITCTKKVLTCWVDSQWRLCTKYKKHQ